MDFTSQLCKWLERHGLTSAEASKILGVPKSSVSVYRSKSKKQNISRGRMALMRRRMGEYTAKHLSEAERVSVDRVNESLRAKRVITERVRELVFLYYTAPEVDRAVFKSTIV